MLSLMRLENRETPSVTSQLLGNQLLVSAYGSYPHTVSFDPGPDSTVQVTADGKVSLFDQGAVQGLIYVGDQTGVNVVQNNTNIQGVLIGGQEDDRLFGGTGLNYLDPGLGVDLVYALLGTNVIRSSDGHQDRIFTNFSAQVTGDPEDLIVRFFNQGRTPGNPYFGLDSQLNDNVLYITPTNNGSYVYLQEVAPGLVVAQYDLGDGRGMQGQVLRGLRAVSFFGGSGNDLYVNNTSLTEAAYGSSGDDTLISGHGAFSILKGSGGNDRLIARAQENDLSGNAGTDLLFVLTVGFRDVFRVDPQDTVFGDGSEDLFISP